jgi:hypothetical protein
MPKVPTEIYSRVSGYFRPVNQWNKGKQAEFSRRQYLRVTEEVNGQAITMCQAGNGYGETVSFSCTV